MTVPAGWKEYEDIVGRFALTYPPNWEVKSQRAGGVTFDLPSDLPGLSALFVKFEYPPSNSVVAAVNEGALNAIVTEAAATFDDFKLLDKGFWKDRGYFVEFTSTAGYQVYVYGLLIDIPFESGYFRLMFSRVGSTITTITEEELDILDTLISTVRFEESMHGQDDSAYPAAETPTTTGMAQVKKSANLRQGPGTNYAVVGGVRAGDVLELLGHNEAGDWLYVESATGPAWIAAFLVEYGDISGLPIERSTAPTITPPTPPPTPVSLDVPLEVPFGREYQYGNWSMKLYDVKKAKAVYFFGNAYVAQGHFLLVFIEFKNISSGTDYPGRQLSFHMTDQQGRVYEYGALDMSKADRYASWQFQAGRLFGDIQPGSVLGVVHTYDLPSDLGHIFLRLKQYPGFVMYLGDFSQLPEE